MTRFKLKTLLAAAAVGLAAVAATAPARAADDVSVRLNWLLGGTNLAWYLGIERGYFEEEGINLTVNEGKGSVVAAQLVAAGEDTFGMSDAASLVTAVSKGAPIKSVMSLRNSSGYAVLYLADSGIETLKDLEGKRLAITAGDSLTQQWPILAKVNDLDESSIKLTYMDAAAKPVAVMEKKVDAMLGNFVDQGVIMEQKGFDVDWIRFSENGVNTVTMTIHTHNDTIENNPDLVRRFVRAAVKTWTAYRDDPQAAIEAALKAKPELNREVITGQTQGNIALMESQATKGKMVGWGAEEDWNHSLNLQRELGKLTSDDPISTYHTNEFLPN